MIDTAPTAAFWQMKLQEGQSWHEWPDEHLVRFLAPRYPTGKGLNALELGFGCGNNLWFLKEQGFQVTGLDITDAATTKAMQFFMSKGIHPTMGMFHVCAMQAMQELFTDDTFDVVVEVKSLQHTNWDDHQQIIQAIWNILKPGGRFYSVHLTSLTTGATKEAKVSPYCYDIHTPGSIGSHNGLVCLPEAVVYLDLLTSKFTVEFARDITQTLSWQSSTGFHLRDEGYLAVECRK